MRKSDLVDLLVNQVGLDSKKKAQDAVDAIFDSIIKSLVNGEEVAISGFGIFRTVRRAARMGVNPKTGEKIQIAASTQPKFKPSKAFKEAVN